MTIAEVCLIVSTSATAVGIILAVVRTWLARQDKKLTHLVTTTRQELLKALGSNMEKQFENEDKTTYLTLDYRMDGEGGETRCLRVPLSYNRVTECLQGMRLQLVEHSDTDTTYSVSTLGYRAPIRLHWHYHDERKTILVVKGAVTDVQTGRRFKAGETWIVEPKVRHIVDYDNAFVLCTVQPPLPWASQYPISLDHIENIYDSPGPAQ